MEKIRFAAGMYGIFRLSFTCTVKLAYKGQLREPSNVLFISRLKLYALSINGENEAALYRQCFDI